MRETVGEPERLSKRVNRNVLQYFRCVERMGSERLNDRVYMSEVRGEGGDGGYLLGGWMEKGKRVLREREECD